MRGVITKLRDTIDTFLTGEYVRRGSFSDIANKGIRVFFVFDERPNLMEVKVKSIDTDEFIWVSIGEMWTTHQERSLAVDKRELCQKYVVNSDRAPLLRKRQLELPNGNWDELTELTKEEKTVKDEIDLNYIKSFTRTIVEIDVVDMDRQLVSRSKMFMTSGHISKLVKKENGKSYVTDSGTVQRLINEYDHLSGNYDFMKDYKNNRIGRKTLIVYPSAFG